MIHSIKFDEKTKRAVIEVDYNPEGEVSASGKTVLVVKENGDTGGRLNGKNVRGGINLYVSAK